MFLQTFLVTTFILAAFILNMDVQNRLFPVVYLSALILITFIPFQSNIFNTKKTKINSIFNRSKKFAWKALPDGTFVRFIFNFAQQLVDIYWQRNICLCICFTICIYICFSICIFICPLNF